MRRWQQEHQPPPAVRTARLDNISIVPASLLPRHTRYQALANQFPQGDILLVVPRSITTHRLLHTVATLFRRQGRRVHTVHVR